MHTVIARHEVRKRRVHARADRHEQIIAVLLHLFNLRVAFREDVIAVIRTQAVGGVEALGTCKEEAVLQIIADGNVELLHGVRSDLERLCAETVGLAGKGHVAAVNIRRERFGRFVDDSHFCAALTRADDELFRCKCAL